MIKDACTVRNHRKSKDAYSKSHIMELMLFLSAFVFHCLLMLLSDRTWHLVTSLGHATGDNKQGKRIPQACNSGAGDVQNCGSAWWYCGGVHWCLGHPTCWVAANMVTWCNLRTSALTTEAMRFYASMARQWWTTNMPRWLWWRQWSWHDLYPKSFRFLVRFCCWKMESQFQGFHLCHLPGGDACSNDWNQSMAGSQEFANVTCIHFSINSLVLPFVTWQFQELCVAKQGSYCLN